MAQAVNVSHLMGVLRRTGYAPDGQPPAGYTIGRDISVLRGLRQRGYSEDDIADALCGVRAVADFELALPEGGRAWLHPREKFTARWLVGAQWQGRDLLGLARDVWRRRRPTAERGGVADVGTVLRRMA